MRKHKTYNQLYDSEGNFILDHSYQEILDLHRMLQEANIPHELRRLDDGWQVIYPEDGAHRICDAIEFYGSYGSNNDLLEVMGTAIIPGYIDDTIEGCVTAKEVFERIQKVHREICTDVYLGEEP